jgi:hypothetical protein
VCLSVCVWQAGKHTRKKEQNCKTHWSIQCSRMLKYSIMNLLPHLRAKTGPVSEKVFFLGGGGFQNTERWMKSKETNILNISYILFLAGATWNCVVRRTMYLFDLRAQVSRYYEGKHWGQIIYRGVWVGFIACSFSFLVRCHIYAKKASARFYYVKLLRSVIYRPVLCNLRCVFISINKIVWNIAYCS